MFGVGSRTRLEFLAEEGGRNPGGVIEAKGHEQAFMSLSREILVNQQIFSASLDLVSGYLMPFYLRHENDWQ